MISILENVTLAPFTSFGIGGPARYLANATSVAELREALQFARGEGLPFGVLGGGTNLLVGDGGFHGVIVRLEMEGIGRTGERVTAEAGADLNALIKRTAGWGLAGMEPLAGIPGLVGGAVRGNAGAYGACIGEFSDRVIALETGSLELVTLEREECRFSYRNSRFKGDPRLIVLSVELSLSLSPGDPGEILAKAEATIAKRTARGLQCSKSVGSFFMNPVVEDPELIRRFESDQQVRCRESRIPAGWLIDQAGLRNLRVGDAMVSALHANYLINAGQATAEEVVRLASLIKRKVAATMGVELQEEVSCLGLSLPPCDLSA